MTACLLIPFSYLIPRLHPGDISNALDATIALGTFLGQILRGQPLIFELEALIHLAVIY
jgi:hypothetical protein